MPAAVMAPEDTAQTKRLVEFAADVAALANERPDLELRDLIDDLHHDLMSFDPRRD